MSITVYGPNYSTYVRSARLALEEKGVPYELAEVDMMGGAHKQPEHLARQPFGVVPTLDHDGFALYETGAIVRYIDEALPGPALQPQDVKTRARMNQIMGIIDAYAYGAIIHKVFWQRAIVPMQGAEPDMEVIEGAMPRVRLCLDEIARLKGDQPFLAGEQVSLADLMLVPIMAYFLMTPEGQAALAERPSLGQWWQAMQARPSLPRTQASLG